MLRLYVYVCLQRWCEKYGSKLVEIENEAENNFLKDNLIQDKGKFKYKYTYLYYIFSFYCQNKFQQNVTQLHTAKRQQLQEAMFGHQAKVLKLLSASSFINSHLKLGTLCDLIHFLMIIL